MKKTNVIICKGCLEVISKAIDQSKEKDVCISCFREQEAVKNNKCLSCGGQNPKKEFWGTCETCFNKKDKGKIE